MATLTSSPDLTGRSAPAAHTEMGRATAGPAIEVADPAPLGLAAFGITTLVLSVINAGWISTDVIPGVLALAVAFGGLGQILAGMWAFRRGNTFAATAFTSFGAFWLSYYLLVNTFIPQMTAAKATPSDVSGFVGLYLFAWGIFTTYMLVASIKSSNAVTAVFVLLAATFFVLAGGAWGNSTTATNVGGYIGILTAIAALYASFADVVNASFGRHTLPTG